MAKVYLLTAGKHSNYHVVGVFSTEEKAEAARAGNPDARVKACEVDELVGQAYGPVWEAEIRKGDGDVFADDYPEFEMRNPDKAVVDDASWVHPDAGSYINVKSPISRDHAIKVATEKRQEWLRNRATVPAT